MTQWIWETVHLDRDPNHVPKPNLTFLTEHDPNHLKEARAQLASPSPRRHGVEECWLCGVTYEHRTVREGRRCDTHTGEGRVRRVGGREACTWCGGKLITSGFEVLVACLLRRQREHADNVERARQRWSILTIALATLGGRDRPEPALGPEGLAWHL